MHSQLEVTDILECKVNLTVQLLVFKENLAAQKLWGVCMEMGS